MACPYFEPQHVNASPEHPIARVPPRLPLMDEYNGLCWAGGEPFPVPGEVRFRCCNHGNSRGTCVHFPASETRSALRYEIVSRTAVALDLLLLEERDYAPQAWQSVRYVLAGELIEPEISDVVKQAQIRAFCRSFLDHFPA